MSESRVLRSADEVTAAWLGHLLQQPVERLHCNAGHGNWSHQIAIEAQMHDGSTRALRLKLCLGSTFGRSEVDYYLRDYVGLAGAPLVHCFDAQFDPAVGYHLLLEDLSATHVDRKELLPTLAHGLALAEALARLHRHHWRSRPAPDGAVLDRYFDEIRPGVAPIERATGQALRERFEHHERALRRRWVDPQGMTLLHGDLNPTNILTPRGADAPLYFIDRQPFDWSLTYGVATYDLAYAMIPWWPETTRRANELAVLRRWHEVLAQPDYGWIQAQADWALAVEQCLHVPIEWCSKPSTIERMRALWQVQLARIQDALARPGSVPVLQTPRSPTASAPESPNP